MRRSRLLLLSLALLWGGCASDERASGDRGWPPPESPRAADPASPSVDTRDADAVARSKAYMSGPNALSAKDAYDKAYHELYGDQPDNGTRHTPRS